MKSTIITEYDFVCEKNYYFELLYTIEQIGSIIGAIVFSLFANKFGKKPIYLLILTGMSILGGIQYFMKNFYIYTSIGFFINSLAAGLDAVLFPLMFETIKASQRTKYGMAMSYIWVILFTLLAPLAYFIKTWRELRLTIFVFITVFALFSWLFIQESITWLISLGKFKEAKRVIKRIAKINRLHNDELFKNEFEKICQVFEQLSKFKEVQKQKNSHSNILSGNINIFEEIFKEKKFFLYLILIVFSW